MSVRVNKDITDADENSMLPSPLIKVVSDGLGFSDVINDNAGNAFFKRMPICSGTFQNFRHLSKVRNGTLSPFTNFPTFHIHRTLNIKPYLTFHVSLCVPLVTSDSVIRSALGYLGTFSHHRNLCL